MRARRLNVAIAALGLLLAAWESLCALGRTDAHPWPVAAVILGFVAALGIGVLLGARAPRLLPLLVAAGVFVALVASPDGLHGAATAGPLGYANADAAMGVQGVVAGCIALVGLARWSRLATGGLVAGLVVVTVLLRSAAADAGVVAVLAVTAWILARRSAPVRALAAGAAALLAGCIVATAVAGATYHPGTSSGIAGRAVTVRRVALWHDAVQLVVDHPLRGVGPRRFPQESATARRDKDTRQAHSAYLQAGAEGGVPAMALLVGLIAALLVRLTVAPAGRAAALAVTAVGALAVHASIDYVLQFPAVVTTAALVAGATAASPRRPPGSRG